MKIKEIREMENDIETRPKLNSINFLIISLCFNAKALSVFNRDNGKKLRFFNLVGMFENVLSREEI